MMKSIHKILLLLIIIFSSCQKREWNNPFEADCPKELFTPTSFSAALVNNSVKLSWTQTATNISGFVIERSVAGGVWSSIATPDKSATTWSDTNLTAGKVHSYRISAKAGSNLSNQVSTQITPILTANLTTSLVTVLDYNAAVLGGSVTDEGGATVTQRGVCYGISQNPTTSNSFLSIGSGIGSFSNVVTGLLPNTTYYARSYAINSQGTSYGSQVSFKTSVAPTASGTVTDLDGNTYNTITIGTQVWMSENLKTTKFSDGTSIPNVTSSTSWAAQTAPAYCWFNNDVTSYKNTYGALYNWYAVSTGKIAPLGWHVATLYEWTTLANYLGGANVAGTKIKLKFGWDQNLGTNNSGFSLLPAGFRAWDNGSFQHIGYAYNYWLAPIDANSNTVLTSYILTDWASMSVPTAQPNSTGDKNGKSVRCVKDALPILATNSVSSVLQTTAICGGTIDYSGGQPIISRGVCWSTSPNPITSNSKSSDGTGLGTFSSSMTGLVTGTTYYVRAYSTNSVGTAYGNQVSFTTSQALSLATLTTNAATSITNSGAIIGGNITSDGNSTVTERGIVYSTSQSPTTSNSKIAIGSGIGSFTSSLTGLAANTTYYVRSYATNSVGTAYGNQISFSTNLTLSLATLTTNAATSITSSSAALGGNISSDGNATVTERGIVYSTTQNPTISNVKIALGSGIGGFASNLTALAANTTYYVRAYAINSVGTTYGNQVSFTTNQTLSLATLTTNSATIITSSGAIIGGNITTDGNATVTDRGVVYATTQNPTTSNSKIAIGSGIGSFASSLTSLAANTTYYVRAYATNSVGTAYGSEINFNTLLVPLPTSGLVAWYPFNGNANDESGNGNNGNINGTTLTNDRYGNNNRAYSFNGITNSISVANSSSLDFSNDILSISFWFKVSSNPISTYEKILISKYSGVGQTTSGFMIGFGINNDFLYRYADVTNNGGWGLIDIQNSKLSSPGSWMHIAIITEKGFDKLYLNGALIASNSSKHNFHLGSNTSSLWIGSGPTQNNYNSYYNELIDDIGIWNRALTDQEVLQLFNMK